MFILENYHVQRFLSLAVSVDSKEIREYEHNEALSVVIAGRASSNYSSVSKVLLQYLQ